MFREIPRSVIANWPTPNYTNPVTRGSELYIVTGIFFGLATLCVLGRLFSRVYLRKYFGLDDWLICFAYIAVFGVNTCVTLGNEKYGWDRHIWDIPMLKLPRGMKVLYFARIWWCLATSAVRLSICCLYFRLLKATRAPRLYFWILRAYAGLTVSLAIVYLFTGIFPCIPIHAYWSLLRIDGQSCIDDSIVMRFIAVSNTSSEVVIALLPAIAARGLNIDRKQQWIVIPALSLSFLVAIAGCFRTYYLWLSTSIADLDMTWYAMPHFIASEVEANLSIICACVPPLCSLAAYIRRRSKSITARAPRNMRPSGSPSITFASQHKHNGDGQVHVGTHAPLDLEIQSEVKHPYGSKSASHYDDATYAGYSKPLLHYFDLEGIACDGYGYTVSISGPPRKTRFLGLQRRHHRRRSVAGEKTSGVPVLERQGPTHPQSSSQILPPFPSHGARASVAADLILSSEKTRQGSAGDLGKRTPRDANQRDSWSTTARASLAPTSDEFDRRYLQLWRWGEEHRRNHMDGEERAGTSWYEK